VCHVEREAYAAATLVARMEDETLAPTPVWDDLLSFDGRPWRGCVDVVASGLPCQPYSLAGKQKGHADERALWPEFVRIVGECEPTIVFLENVPPFLKHFEPVYDELLRMDFVFARPLRTSAAARGAPHRRRRIFIAAAHPERVDLWQQSWRSSGESGTSEAQLGFDDSVVADSECLGRSFGEGPKRRSNINRQKTRRKKGSSGSSGNCTFDSDVDGGGRKGERSFWVFDREQQTLGHDAHGLCDGCSPVGSDWQVESPVLRVADGPPNRVDRLRAIGNAVIPAMAAAAWRELVVEDLRIDFNLRR